MEEVKLSFRDKLRLKKEMKFQTLLEENNLNMSSELLWNGKKVGIKGTLILKSDHNLKKRHFKKIEYIDGDLILRDVDYAPFVNLETISGTLTINNSSRFHFPKLSSVHNIDLKKIDSSFIVSFPSLEEMTGNLSVGSRVLLDISNLEIISGNLDVRMSASLYAPFLEYIGKNLNIGKYTKVALYNLTHVKESVNIDQINMLRMDNLTLVGRNFDLNPSLESELELGKHIYVGEVFEGTLIDEVFITANYIKALKNLEIRNDIVKVENELFLIIDENHFADVEIYQLHDRVLTLFDNKYVFTDEHIEGFLEAKRIQSGMTERELELVMNNYELPIDTVQKLFKFLYGVEVTKPSLLRRFGLENDKLYTTEYILEIFYSKNVINVFTMIFQAE